MRTILIFLIIFSINVMADDLVEGMEAPVFSLPNTDNEYVALRDICGKTLRKPWKNKTKYVVVISFFASWCKPCIAEIPHLQKVAEKFKDKNVKFYLINVGEPKETIDKFLENKEVSLTILMDRYNKISEKYDALKLPRLFVIDPDGFIQLQKRGFGDSGEKFEEEIETTLHQILEK